MLSADCLVDVTDQIQPARLAPRALAYGWTFRGHDARVGSLVVSNDSVGKGDAVRAGSGAVDYLKSVRRSIAFHLADVLARHIR